MERLAEQAKTLAPGTIEAYQTLVVEAERRVRGASPEHRNLVLELDQARDLTQSQEVLDELQRARLLTQYPDREVPFVELAPPDIGLTTLIASSLNEVGSSLEAVLSAWRDAGSISEYTVAHFNHGEGSTGEFGDAQDGHSFEIVTSREKILALTGDFGLISQARERFCELCTDVTEMPLTATNARPAPPVMQQLGVDYHVVYERSLLKRPAGQAGVRACIQSGEEARVVEALPLKLKIVDGNSSSGSKVALVALSNTGATKALLIRNPLVVDALQTLFDYTWKEATPLDIDNDDRVVERPLPGADGLSPFDQKILLLLAKGLSATAITTALNEEGINCSERTVQRTRDRLRRQLGAVGQFDFGVRAVLMGWVDTTAIDMSPRADTR